MSLLPDVPTIAERGYPGFETRTWFGLWGPAKLAPEKAAKVAADVKWALNSPEVVEKLKGQGWDVVASSPAEFSAVLESEYERWAAVIKSAKITKQEK
jgi:tripartite-type tricarboxylate transporter receptor subunit TctC